MNVALGDKPGVALLHRYRDSNNGRHTLLEGDTSGGTVEVPVETLRDVWERERLGVRPVALLKIDVEGFECLVLRGAGDLLKRCRHVLLEYSPEGLQLAGLPPEALIEPLRAAGLEARVFAGSDLVPISYAELARADSQKDLLLRPAAPRG
jgi:hypothetical protein